MRGWKLRKGTVAILRADSHWPVMRRALMLCLLVFVDGLGEGDADELGDRLLQVVHHQIVDPVGLLGRERLLLLGGARLLCGGGPVTGGPLTALPA